LSFRQLETALAWSVRPVNPLHVFEVASRVGSFTNAAEILSVSPSAKYCLHLCDISAGA
jgi:hypothetical protein